MKRLMVTMVAVVLLTSIGAQAGFSLGLINITHEAKTVGVENQTDCKSTTSWGGSGHQIANLPDIGQGGTDDDGKPLPNLANFQHQRDNTVTNTADLSAAVDLVRANQSDYSKAGGDNTQSGTGDKNDAGPSLNAAVTGQGVSGAAQKQPNATGQPTNTETISVDKTQLDEFIRQAELNQRALEKARADVAALKAQLAALEPDGGPQPAPSD